MIDTGVRGRRDRLPTPWLNWQLVRACPGPYAIHFVAEILVLAVPLGLGLVEKAVFDGITGAAPAGPSIGTLVALYVALGLGRFGAALAEGWGSYTFRRAVGKLLRHNLFASLLRRPGAAPLPIAVGEAINRFRDDVNEVADFPTWAPDVVGQILSFAVAVWIMAHINLPITLIVFLPLVAAIFLSRIAWGRFLAFIRTARLSADAVTGYLGEIFGAAQAIKLAGAEAGVVGRYRVLNRTRRRAAVNVRVLWESIAAISGVSAAFGVSVTLLLAGRLLAAGSFTVGDFALFVSYLWFTTDLPAFLGTFVGDYRQQDVAIARLSELIPDETPRVLVEFGKDESGIADGQSPGSAGILPARGGDGRANRDSWRIPIVLDRIGLGRPHPHPLPKGEGIPISPPANKGGTPSSPLTLGEGEGVSSPGRPAVVVRRPFFQGAARFALSSNVTAPAISTDPLETLVARGVTYRYPSSGRGVVDVDLSIRRGSFSVVTGRIGSGKTTLLRVLLGLLPVTFGEIRWNDGLVEDRSALFRPPRCAYVPQVPRLFSDSVRSNVLLGMPASDAALAAALRTAVLEPDLAALANGLETVVGPRGVRLSGGQVQRVAAARSLVRTPELLVCDDLSSALDVETERTLWQRLRERGETTCLIVSHRRPVLAQADQIVVLKDGQVEALGRLDDLLQRSDELRRIWEAEPRGGQGEE